MIGCIIQSRMSSRRLPGKIMKIVDSKPILYHVINQVSSSKILEKIVVATSTNTDDDMIENFTKKLGISCFRGKLNDVLGRHYQCAKKFSFDTIVRIPSDKPLIDPNVIDEVITQFTSGQYDYTSNFVYPLQYNIGTEVEVFSFNALEKANKSAKKPSEREHIFPYFHNHKNKFKIKFVSNLNDVNHLRYSLDRKEDLKLIQEVFSRIKKRPILKNDILELFSKNPEFFDINKYFDPNEGQIQSLKHDIKSS
tara:strand:- start:276 stop:1031 length:756 start_codon:yes stop_codon:yes gene_type:complete